MIHHDNRLILIASLAGKERTKTEVIAQVTQTTCKESQENASGSKA
jgi:hypothetical protein